MNYNVQLWSGSGYQLNEPYNVDANDEIEALEKAAVHGIKTGGVVALEVSTEHEELEEDDNYIYLDLTRYGMGCFYLLIENAKIEGGSQ